MWSRFAFIAEDRRLISKLTSAANAFIKRQDWPPPHETGDGRSNRNRLAQRPRRWRRHDGFFCLEESAADGPNLSPPPSPPPRHSTDRALFPPLHFRLD